MVLLLLVLPFRCFFLCCHFFLILWFLLLICLSLFSLYSPVLQLLRFLLSCIFFIYVFHLRVSGFKIPLKHYSHTSLSFSFKFFFNLSFSYYIKGRTSLRGYHKCHYFNQIWALLFCYQLLDFFHYTFHTTIFSIAVNGCKFGKFIYIYIYIFCIYVIYACLCIDVHIYMLYIYVSNIYGYTCIFLRYIYMYRNKNFQENLSRSWFSLL